MKDELKQAKSKAKEAFDQLETLLAECMISGMKDYESRFYNELTELSEDLYEIDSWSELQELILQAKTIEKDLAAWLALKGRNTMSLNWPLQPPLSEE